MTASGRGGMREGGGGKGRKRRRERKGEEGGERKGGRRGDNDDAHVHLNAVSTVCTVKRPVRYRPQSRRLSSGSAMTARSAPCSFRRIGERQSSGCKCDLFGSSAAGPGMRNFALRAGSRNERVPLRWHRLGGELRSVGTSPAIARPLLILSTSDPGHSVPPTDDRRWLRR